MTILYKIITVWVHETQVSDSTFPIVIASLGGSCPLLKFTIFVIASLGGSVYLKCFVSFLYLQNLSTPLWVDLFILRVLSASHICNICQHFWIDLLDIWNFLTSIIYCAAEQEMRCNDSSPDRRSTSEIAFSGMNIGEYYWWILLVDIVGGLLVDIIGG